MFAVNGWRKRKDFRSIDFPSPLPPPLLLSLPPPWTILWWRSILSLLENPRWQTEHRMSVGFPVQSSLPLINSHCLLRKWSRQKTWSSLKRQTQTVVLQGDFQLIKLKDFCLVVYRSFKGHVRQFFVQDADGLENRLVRVSVVRIISHEIPAYVNPSGELVGVSNAGTKETFNNAHSHLSFTGYVRGNCTRNCPPELSPKCSRESSLLTNT